MASGENDVSVEAARECSPSSGRLWRRRSLGIGGGISPSCSLFSRRAVWTSGKGVTRQSIDQHQCFLDLEPPPSVSPVSRCIWWRKLAGDRWWHAVVMLAAAATMYSPTSSWSLTMDIGLSVARPPRAGLRNAANNHRRVLCFVMLLSCSVVYRRKTGEVAEVARRTGKDDGEVWPARMLRHHRTPLLCLAGRRVGDATGASLLSLHCQAWFSCCDARDSGMPPCIPAGNEGRRTEMLGRRRRTRRSRSPVVEVAVVATIAVHRCCLLLRRRRSERTDEGRQGSNYG
nr:hypothetical protein Iba_chr08fCG0190 [Ipomoea batatas]